MLQRIDRAVRLITAAAAVRRKALELASTGRTMAAMRLSAAADALNYAAGGDTVGKRMAAAEARFYFRAARRHA